MYLTYMARIHTTISIDEETLKNAKEKGINLSGTINVLLDKYLKIEENRELSEEELQVIKKAEDTKARFNEIYDLCRGFWNSPQGKEALLKSRERHAKQNNENTDSSPAEDSLA